MFPSFSMEWLVAVHVALSLVAIASGLVAISALAAGRWLPGWQGIFLVTTVLTSVTGFLFPFSGITPAFIFGVLSLVALAIASFALPRRASNRTAQIAYAAAATFALYLNMFVLAVQSFQKLPVLQPLAPTQSESPFLITQLVLLIAVCVLGWLASRPPTRVFLPQGRV